MHRKVFIGGLVALLTGAIAQPARAAGRAVRQRLGSAMVTLIAEGLRFEDEQGNLHGEVRGGEPFVGQSSGVWVGPFLGIASGAYKDTWSRLDEGELAFQIGPQPGYRYRADGIVRPDGTVGHLLSQDDAALLARLHGAWFYHPMPASRTITISGNAGEMIDVRPAQYGVPAGAKAVHVTGWLQTRPPGTVRLFSAGMGQRNGIYGKREMVPDGRVPLTDGEFCVMGSVDGWKADLYIQGYWL